MPLPGGPSAKAGALYERLWAALQVLRVFEEGVHSVRLEPPGVDFAEFVVHTESGSVYHQVKIGRGASGVWTIGSLADVLLAFLQRRRTEEFAQFVFVSQHGTRWIEELASRAKSALNVEEFLGKFLAAQGASRAFTDLCTVTQGESKEVFDLLRSLKVETASRRVLHDSVKKTIGNYFTGDPSVGCAVLESLIEESVHVVIDEIVVKDHMRRHSVAFGAPRLPAPMHSLSAPRPVELFGRDETLRDISEKLLPGTTVVLAGPSGVGKTALGAATVGDADAVIWLPCRDRTLAQVVIMLSEFVKPVQQFESLVGLFGRPLLEPEQVGAGIAWIANAMKAVVVWDDAGIGEEFVRAIESTASRLEDGAQLVSAQEVPILWERFDVVRVPPLSSADVITFVRSESGCRPTEEMVRATCGLPQLCVLAVALMRRSAVSVGGIVEAARGDLVDRALKGLTSLEWELLCLLSIFRSGMRPELVHPNEARAAVTLLGRSLVQTEAGGPISAHDAVRLRVLGGLSEEEVRLLHIEAAGRLQTLDDSGLMDLYDLALHARRAGKVGLAQSCVNRFVDLAMHQGAWNLVLELTDALEVEPVPTGWEPALFGRGRAFRVAGDYEMALVAYAAAEAGKGRVADSSRAEKAAILAMLGRPVEALEAYSSLLLHAELGIRCQAAIGSALIKERLGDTEAAGELIQGILEQTGADDIGSRHARMHAVQVLGEIAYRAGDFPAAIEALQECYRIRVEYFGKTFGADIIGWRHLYHVLLDCHAMLMQRELAASAAKALFELEVLAPREVEAARTVYLLAGACEIGDEIAAGACDWLRLRIEALPAESPVREMTEYLGAALWSIDRRREALDAVLDFDGESTKGIPVFFKELEAGAPTFVRAAPVEGGLMLFLDDEFGQAELSALLGEFDFEGRREVFVGSFDGEG